VHTHIKELAKLPDGTRFSAQVNEARLKFSPYIRDAIIVAGKGRPFVSAIIQIDFDITGEWAEKKKIGYTTFADLSQKAQVCDFLRKEVEKMNENIPSSARIKRFVLTNKEFDPDEAELTRTRKLRREYVEKKYAGYIDALYSDKETCEVESDVKYRDGRVSKIKAEIRVVDVE